MSIELRIPALGESITDVEIGAWLKGPGDAVRKDEPLVTIESEKATVELPAPDAGTLGKILKQKGEVAKVGDVIGYLDNGANGSPTPAVAAPASAPPAALPAEATPRAGQASEDQAPPNRPAKDEGVRAPEPARPAAGAVKAPAEAPAALPMSQAVVLSPGLAAVAGREEETVPMSRLRRTVAEQLVEAHRTAALLTTFNEIDMSGTIALRKSYGEAFQRKYNVKLGFMSFFVKACIDALKQFPILNAEVRGTNIIYHNYFDIGVAIGSGKGLVVPVLRNAERLSFAQVELAVADFARRARENKLKLDELEGGTFTISNGGVYGSMLSTPIVNPPQSGVLGMHAIQDRPVAREGAVVIRPIMYVALTYDHRIVDGREAVSFLKHMREVIENPARMLMEI
jgi:2-oxoglutarate dehydrogenase E2 component (dihydrolipoamide succinyltransferase)